MMKTFSKVKIPVVCWHGINDNSESCKTVFSTLPNGTYTLSIQIGDTLEADQYNSVFMDMMDQVHFFIQWRHKRLICS